MTKLTQDAMEAINVANGIDEAEKFNVGPLTMRHVFEPNGIKNVADLQAVLDAVEAALAADVAQSRIAELEDLIGRYASEVGDSNGVYFEPSGPEGEYIIELAKREDARAALGDGA